MEDTMKKGLITKVLFKGQKVYGVISEFDEANVTVRFPICGVSGQVEIAEQILPAADCRKPMLRQDTELATLIRQLVGVPLEKEVQ
jgi:hypothetical protein